MDLYADYYNILNNKPLSFINKMLTHKYKKNMERRNWEIYLVNYGRMTKDTFEEYRDTLKEKISARSTEDILKEAEEIKAKIDAERR